MKLPYPHQRTNCKDGFLIDTVSRHKLKYQFISCNRGFGILNIRCVCRIKDWVNDNLDLYLNLNTPNDILEQT